MGKKIKSAVTDFLKRLSASKRKLIYLPLTGLIILVSLGFLTDSFDNIAKKYKAYIYCNAPELPDKIK